MDEDTNEQNEDAERTYKTQQEKQYRGQDQRYGQKRGNYQDKSHKHQRNFKKGPTEAELEKITKVDPDNYPPLA